MLFKSFVPSFGHKRASLASSLYRYPIMQDRGSGMLTNSLKTGFICTTRIHRKSPPPRPLLASSQGLTWEFITFKNPFFVITRTAYMMRRWLSVPNQNRGVGASQKLIVLMCVWRVVLVECKHYYSTLLIKYKLPRASAWSRRCVLRSITQARRPAVGPRVVLSRRIDVLSLCVCCTLYVAEDPLDGKQHVQPFVSA